MVSSLSYDYKPRSQSTSLITFCTFLDLHRRFSSVDPEKLHSGTCVVLNVFTCETAALDCQPVESVHLLTTLRRSCRVVSCRVSRSDR